MFQTCSTLQLQPRCIEDLRGILESEDLVLRDIGESQYYWYRPSRVANSSQLRHDVELVYSSADRDIVNTLFVDARAVIHAAVRAQGVDLMIRDRSKPEPPACSGWVSRRPYEAIPLAHAETLIRNGFLLRSLVLGSKNLKIR